MNQLIETLESIVEEGEWALAAGWSVDKLREHLGTMVGQARYGIDQALDLQLAKEEYQHASD